MTRELNRLGSLLLLPALATLHAATPAAGQTAISVHAGVTSAELRAEDTEERSDGSRRGLSLGAGVSFGFLPGMGLYLGGSYVQRGASLGVLADDIVDAFFADVKLDYIELQALARVNLPAGLASLHLLAGPTVAFEMNCASDLTYSLGGDTVESDSGRDYSDVPCTERDYDLGIADTEALEFGVAGGIGAEFSLGGLLNLSLQALYTSGLSEILEDTKNRATHLRAGISVPIL